jgi:hypothetical protein
MICLATPKALANSQPRVAATLGHTNGKSTTLKALANARDLANASSVVNHCNLLVPRVASTLGHTNGKYNAESVGERA